MLDDHHILKRGATSGTGNAVRAWLRQQLIGNVAIGLDKRSLIFGAIFFISMAVAASVAVILGLGTAAVLAALSAMFVLIAASGGPLRSDLRMMTWFGPCFILAVGGVHWLTIVSPWWTIPVIVVIVFIAGLLPAFSARYTTVGTALVLGVLIGFGVRLPTNLAVVSIFEAIAVGVIVAVLVRLVLGVGDPSLVTRKTIARVLIDADMGAMDNAWKTARADRPTRWMSEALSGAAAYRVGRLILTARLEQLSGRDAQLLQSILAEADKEARELVGLIEAKKVPAIAAPAQHEDRETAERLSPEQQEMVARLWRALEKVRVAALGRDRTPATIPNVPEVSFYALARTLVAWDSSIVQHALRCAIVVLVALIIASLHRNNPLNTTFLTATFAIMQPTQLGTAAKAVQRMVGAIIGVCIAGGLALLVPATALLLLAIVALLLAFPFMLKNMTIYYAMMAIMTLLLSISNGSLPASVGLLEYLLYIIVAAGIALFFIFVVPRVELNVVKRTRKAMDAMRTLLLSASSVQENASSVRDNYILAARAVQNLLAAPDQLTPALQQKWNMMTQVGNALKNMLADVSALEFQSATQASVAAELSDAEQLLNLNDTMDYEPIMAEVRRLTPGEGELPQSLLMAHALVARHTAMQLLGLERGVHVGV